MIWFAASKEKPIEIDVAIYRIHLVVFAGWTLDDMIQWGIDSSVDPACFNENWRHWMRDAIDNAQGLCANFGHNNSDVLIWLKVKPEKASEYGTLWHELSHAVDKIANHCDPQSRFYDDRWMSEPRAFLYEYLAVAITKDLWNR